MAPTRNHNVRSPGSLADETPEEIGCVVDEARTRSDQGEGLADDAADGV
ncbi:hypothetical protein [Polyangium sp. 6x1]|nr:hypothetical protein [Polyangium sp. 6x1]MDI1447930.1 hypothetical protein [Polyangium sp. 6x1]